VRNEESAGLGFKAVVCCRVIKWTIREDIRKHTIDEVIVSVEENQFNRQNPRVVAEDARIDKHASETCLE
jgi:hypothetical protein